MAALNPAALISTARESSGLTQTEFANRAGTSQPAVARYESGAASPSTATLMRLLKAGGYELDVQLRKASPSNLSSLRARKIREHRGEIRRLARAAGATNIRVFGSVARGDDNQDSDIDFLVDYEISGSGGIPLITLKDQLESLLDEKVDIAPTDVLKKSILEVALSECIPL
jgi:predicted nucleotidyltransferase/DNA-binding XRE family transcriptional regulator